MKKEKLLALLGSVCLVLVLAAMPFMAACAPEEVVPPPPPPPPEEEEEPTPPPMEPVTLKMATMFVSPEDIRQIYTEKWGEAITEATGGLIKFEYYPAGQLVKATELSDALGAGIIDATTWFVPAYTPEDYPFLSAALNLPFAYPNTYEAFWGVNTDAHDLLTGPLEAHNIKYCWGMYGSYGQEWYFADPWDPEDLAKNFKGKKVRISAGITSEILLNYLGAELVTMSAPKIYESGQRGLIDGAALGISQYVGTHVYEVFPYVMWGNTTFCPFGGLPCVIRLDLFNSFPESIQKQIMDVSREIEEEFFYAYLAEADELRDDLVSKGLIKQYVELDPETKAKWKKDLDVLIDEGMREQFPDKWPKLKAVLDKYWE